MTPISVSLAPDVWSHVLRALKKYGIAERRRLAEARDYVEEDPDDPRARAGRLLGLEAGIAAARAASAAIGDAVAAPDNRRFR